MTWHISASTCCLEGDGFSFDVPKKWPAEDKMPKKIKLIKVYNKNVIFVEYLNPLLSYIQNKYKKNIIIT